MSWALLSLFPVIGVVLFASSILVLICPEQANADAGIPMIFVTYPAVLVALLPIIILEVVIFKRGLHLGYRPVTWHVGTANVVSTVIGFPLTWFLCMLLQMFTGGGSFYRAGIWGTVLRVTWQAPWLLPLSHTGEENWMVPTAAIVGLIPAFFASVGIEGVILRRLLKAVDATSVWRLTWKANMASYCILMGLAGIWLIRVINTVHRVR